MRPYFQGGGRRLSVAEKVYLNGGFVDKDAATISVFDRGFLLGDALFETMRAYHGRVFRCEYHIERLRSGGRTLGLPVPETTNLRHAIHETIRVNGLSDAVVRLTISRGPGPLGIVPSSERPGERPSESPPSPTVVIMAEPLNPWPADYYERGAGAIIVSDRRNQMSPLTAVKTTNFAANVLASLQARNEKAVEAIFLNTRGNVAEGATSNVFVVSGGYVISPFEEDGLLPGVTRQVVFELCEKLFIPAVRKNLAAPELWKADECFLTGTTKEIMPIVRVDEHRVGSGKPGPVTLKLLEAYRALVQQELERGGP